MNQYKEDVEIDLVRLFKYLLSKFKLLVLIGAVFALAGLGYKYYSVELSGKNFADDPNLLSYETTVKLPNGTTKNEKHKVSFNQYMAEMERRKSSNEVQESLASYEKARINSEIKVLENTLKDHQNYLENSVLLGSDKTGYEAVHYYLASEKGVKNLIKLKPVIRNNYKPSGVINTDKKIKADEGDDSELTKFEEKDSALISFARTLLYSDKFANEFASALGLSDETSTLQIEGLVTLNKVDDISFTISLKSKNKDDIQKLQLVLSKYDRELTEFLKNEYDISSNEISFAKLKSSYIDTLREKETQTINKLLIKIENKKEKLNEVPLVLEPVSAVDLNKLKLKKYAIFTFGGFAIGIFLALGCFTCVYLFDGKIHDPENLVFEDLKTLACVHSSSYCEAKADEIQKLNESVEVLCRGKQSVTVVSTLAESEIVNVTSVIKDALSVNGISNCKIVKPQHMKDISSADALIIAEKIDFSKLDDVIGEIVQIKNIKKDILGIVFA
ncbi:hypothetical protein SAMN02745213_00897 [Succinivibrio dextrinosolvens DSM 3072]|uniref:Chain length determinant protein n=1 Tax=Succinivibrio dextrinosolvens DSM 3072 TaxID=1123324 RepID=A0A1T4V6J3_9GAMM|nr:hypothetical protein [Succinivibrio dextrinosolvens]SKA60537.1 hypothetical protein SAMN02745213_00897 [Succinivibrio dextrinosolvens DSM 3072]